MVLSGVIPYGVLPAWMYHAQLPPPTHAFDPSRPGLTWVDLVFPLFLFSMGAAIPLALSRRLSAGDSILKITLGTLERGFLLFFFAVFLRHVRPHVLNPHPTAITWGTALLGFIVMFLIFLRLPQTWSRWVRLACRGLGWAGAVSLLAVLRYPDGSGFSLGRSDIIIVVLANVAVSGSLLWLATRETLLPRLGVLGILIGLRLAAPEQGWVSWVWRATPAPWMYKLYYHQYLFVVIPGTIAGDYLRAHMSQAKTVPHTHEAWGAPQLWGIVGAMVAAVVTALVGLQARWLWQTTVALSALCLVATLLSKKASSPREQMVRSFILWGIYWLIVGLVFEPYEGGIKKDHPTLSYYLVTTGLALFLLAAFTILIEMLNRRSWLQLLIDNGQNPMIAYVGVANAIWPVFGLTGVDRLLVRITATPWLGVLRGLAYTLLLALMVRCFTRRRLVWRT